VKEIEIRDEYEVDDYERIEVALKSGIKSWIHVGKLHNKK